MGIYDRDYGRDEQRTPWDRAQNPRSITLTLLIINVVVYLADILIYRQEPGGGRLHLLHEPLAVHGDTILKPWMWWQFLTYAFVHDVRSSFPSHLLFNMIGLYIFGRSVEQKIGRMEFLRFYLIAAVLGGIIGSIWHALSGGGYTVGASGAVVATTVLFACYFPNREVLLMMVFPIKAWVLAVVFVMFDLVGAIGALTGADSHSNTAFTVHLAGAFFAAGYYFQGWSLRWLDLAAIGEFPQRMRQRSRRMKLKLHDPDRKLQREAEEADRILAKIHQSGEASLTSSERKTLERYSRRQRERRNR